MISKFIMNIISKYLYAIVIGISSLMPTKIYRLSPSFAFEWQIKLQGTVIEVLYEGYQYDDDFYLVQLTDGTLIEICSDDLQVNDSVTVYYNNGEVIHTLYGKR